MLADIKRVISEYSNEIENKTLKESKNIMRRDIYRAFIVGAFLRTNEEAKNIYDKCKNNDEILSEVNKLINKANEDKNEELYDYLLLLKTNIENYLEKEKENLTKADLEKSLSKSNEENYLHLMNINDLKEENKDLKQIKEEVSKLKQDNNRLNTIVINLETSKKNKETTIKNYETTINNLATTVNNHETTIKNQETTIKNYETTINNHEAKINELNEKVGFMEPIVTSLICRKALNHAIIQILQKNKKDLKVERHDLSNNDYTYDITFIDSVNNISKEELNNLINKIFNKKDKFNDDSHLIQKDLPSFIHDVWEKVIQHLELNENELAAFNAIITNEIK